MAPHASRRSQRLCPAAIATAPFRAAVARKDAATLDLTLGAKLTGLPITPSLFHLCLALCTGGNCGLRWNGVECVSRGRLRGTASSAEFSLPLSARYGMSLTSDRDAFPKVWSLTQLTPNPLPSARPPFAHVHLYEAPAGAIGILGRATTSILYPDRFHRYSNPTFRISEYGLLPPGYQLARSPKGPV